MRISDWSSDVCSSDLDRAAHGGDPADLVHRRPDHGEVEPVGAADVAVEDVADVEAEIDRGDRPLLRRPAGVELAHATPQLGLRPERGPARLRPIGAGERSEEPTSELQPLMRISYAVFGLKKKHQLYA